MAIDLEPLSRNELEKLKTQIDKALSKRAQTERKAAKAAAEKAAAKFGYKLSDLAGRAASKKGSKTAPKYRNPSDASQTWTGRGRKPNWFTDAIKAGTSAEAMEV